MKSFQELHADLFGLEEVTDKYDHIIEYGAIAKPAFTVSKSDSSLVKGCTSNLWVKRIDGNIYCYAESLIVQGFASMICDWWNQASHLKREEFSLNTLNEIGLAPLLSMGRQNGIANLIAKIKTL